jgi:hypothetical protein
MVHLRLFIFIPLKLWYSNASSSRMWTSDFKRVAAERRVRTAGLVYSVIKTCLINIRKSHFIHAVRLTRMCPMEEEKQTHILKGISICKISTGI